MLLEAQLKPLMLRSLTGDDKAYRSLLEKLTHWLRGRIKAQLYHTKNTKLEAEDIVQEVLMAIHLKKHTYDANQPFLVWVWAVARYKMIDKLRQKSFFIELPHEDFIENIPQEEESIVSDIPLNKLVEALPEQQKQIVLAISSGVSLSETAQNLNLNEGTIRVNLHRAVKKMSLLFKSMEA